MSLTKPLLRPWLRKAGASPRAAEDEATMERNTDSPLCRNDNEMNMTKVADAKLMNGMEAALTLACCLMNVAQMTLPFCFVRVGWLAALLIILVSLLCMHTALMLQEALVALVRQGVPLPEYLDVAKTSVGPFCAGFAQIVALAELAVYGSSGAINLGHALRSWLPLEETSAILLGIGLCIAMSVFSDRAFAYIGLLSSVASLVILALLVYGGLNEPEWANPTSFIADLDYLPSTSAMILFTAGTHPLICSVMHTTRSHKELRRATVAAWTFFTIVTVAVGGVLYQIYGDALQPAVMANVKHELRSVAGIWMLVKVLGNYIPLTRPLGNALGRALGVTQTAGPVLMAPVLLCLAVVAAFFSEKLEVLESVAGCTITSFNVLLVPAISYLAICRPRGGMYCCAIAYAALGLALCLAPMWHAM